MSHPKPNYSNLAPNFADLITAINLKRVENYQLPKEYPANWAGLVAAVLDLNWGQAATGPQPPTWNETSDTFVPAPSEGALWYDTRQGRLFVYAHGDWYQTNGGDGYATLKDSTSPNPSTSLAGQFWLDPLSNNLYIFNGNTWESVKSTVTITKDQMISVLNSSADYAAFKTNMLTLLS